MRQGPHTYLHRGARSRDEDMPRDVRQDGRYVCCPPLTSHFVPSSLSLSATHIRITLDRPVWRRAQRRALQGPSLRAHPPACTARHRTDGVLRRCRQPACGPHDDGLPYAPPRHLSAELVRVSLAAQERGFPLPALHGQSLRRPDRLRYLRADDRELAPFGEELPSFVPRQAVCAYVSPFISFSSLFYSLVRESNSGE